MARGQQGIRQHPAQPHGFAVPSPLPPTTRAMTQQGDSAGTSIRAGGDHHDVSWHRKSIVPPQLRGAPQGYGDDPVTGAARRTVHVRG